MIAVVVPTDNVEASVYYTGSVAPTDAAGSPKDVFFRGDPVYVDVGLMYMGDPVPGSIKVNLERVTDGATVSSFTGTTNNPVVGWFNSSVAGPSLWTGSWFSGDLMVYDVVAYYTGGGWDEEIGRQPIIVKSLGLWMEPSSMWNYPGQVVSFTLSTTHTTDVFYVQIVNDTGATVMNWTGLVALDGYWSATWTLPLDLPDGGYDVYVRSAATHALWNFLNFWVQKYVLVTIPDRNTLLPGETTNISYTVLDSAALLPYSGATITYSAYWTNDTDAEVWLNGTLPGSAGTHSFQVPADIALYSDVRISYWANESGIWSFLTIVDLYVELMTVEVSVDPGPYTPGDTVLVTVDAGVEWNGMPDASVDIVVEHGGIALPAYGAAGLLTDETGSVQHSFRLDSGASQGSYLVRVSVSKAGHTVELMTVFEVEFSAFVEVEFDKDYYYGGDTAQVHISVVWNHAQLSGQLVAYFVVTPGGDLISGQNTTGIVEFEVPIDAVGMLFVEADTNVNGYLISGSAMTTVIAAEIDLTPEMSEYLPGETIVFNYEIGTNLAGGVVEWQILDDIGANVVSGSRPFSKAGSFSYTVPSAWCSDFYEARVVYYMPSGGQVEDSATVTKAILPPGILVLLTVDNPAEGAVVNVPVIRANGTSVPWMLLSVNGFAVVTEEDGSFEVNIPLLEGLNQIAITTMGGMDERTIVRNVTYDNPVPDMQVEMTGLASDVASLQADLSVVWDGLNTTNLDVASVWDDLNATQEDVETAWSLVNSTSATLTVLQAKVDALRTELITAHNAVNGTQSDVAAIESALDSLQVQIDTASASLNETVADLAEVQSQLDTVQSDLETSQDEIDARATSSSVTMWFAVAVILSIVFAAAVFMLLRKKP